MAAGGGARRCVFPPEGLAVSIPWLIFLDCPEVGSLSEFIPLAVRISWRPLGTPGSLIAVLTPSLGAILSTAEREPGRLAGISEVQAAGLSPSPLRSPQASPVPALWTGAWNPDLKQPPGPLSWADSKLAGPAHGQQDREPETAGDGERSP